MAEKTKAVAQSPAPDLSAVERVVALGDLSKLSSEERVVYYARVCESLQLNPLTRPFEYLTLKGKLVLYARKDCTEQLRRIHKISLEIVGQQEVGDMILVHVRAKMGGRHDEDFGAVPLGRLAGEDRCNAVLKAITKAKRRATLSICGLGFLDETEVESVQAAEAQQPVQQRPALPAPQQANAGAQKARDAILYGLRDRIKAAGKNKTILAEIAGDARANRQAMGEINFTLIANDLKAAKVALETPEPEAAATGEREEQVAALLNAKDARWHYVLESCGIGGENPDELSQEEFDAAIAFLEAMPDVQGAAAV